MAWYDKTDTGEIINRITVDINAIQEGLSDKVGLILQFVTTFVTGFVIGFTKGWQLSLVLCSVFPLLSGAAIIMSKVLASGASSESGAYASAGSVAQQAIASIRTVQEFGGEQKEIERYGKFLDVAEKAGLKKAVFNGVGVGTIQGLIFLVYALAFYYGNTLIPQVMDGGKVMNVLFAIVIGAFSLGNATPHIGAIGNACGAAYKVFETIERQSPIDPLSEQGKSPDQVVGQISFKGVSFVYPTRADVTVLEDFNLEVPAGKSFALVGMSGSGKSTIVKLLERFYDPTKGDVFLDGVNLKDLNVRWLRENISIVSQEPILFNCSIRQNIKYGLTEKDWGLSTEEINKKIEESCRMANAWDFIQKLPQGLDTTVGESGSTLSGGQKQRIAIARAIIKNPKVLLLVNFIHLG